MKHLRNDRLALYAGRDLGRWESWRVERHLAGCPLCRQEAEAFSIARARVDDLASEAPPGMNWNRLAGEMSGNIRVGLAAGECVSDFNRHSPRHTALGWNAAGVLTLATVIVLGILSVNLPRAELDHLGHALKSIRWDRIGRITPTVTTAAIGESGVILEASQSSGGVEVKENGRAMSLLHPHSDGATASVNTQDSAGVRFVDSDTGQVTTNKVYYAQ